MALKVLYAISGSQYLTSGDITSIIFNVDGWTLQSGIIRQSGFVNLPKASREASMQALIFQLMLLTTLFGFEAAMVHFVVALH